MDTLASGLLQELDNIKKKTIVMTIKDILLRCHLMKAMVTHSPGHSLSIAIKSLAKDCTILCDVMRTVGETCVLVKHSTMEL